MSTYSQLRQIIPADQALSNKALQAALEQVKTIFDSSLPLVAGATVGLESNVGLDLINALTEPLPANVIAYFTSTNSFATGTGEDGLFLLTDFIGTPTGWVHNEALANTTSILNTMTSVGAFNTLTDATTGVYTIMENTIAGDYTTTSTVPNPDPPPPDLTEYTVTIPGGLPGAGTYGPYGSESAAIQAAFTEGLTPAMISAVNTIISNNSANVAQTTTNFNNMSAQIVRENTNLTSAGVVLTDLVVGMEPMGLVTGLASNGRDTTEGGAAYVMQSLATNTQGGQAIISTMREARNQDRLSVAGITTDIIVSDEVAEPQADLGTSQYTVAQATSQKII
jgi:hypothetical protein